MSSTSAAVPTVPQRVVHHGDAIEWLRAHGRLDGGSVVTSLPDVSEVPELGFEGWQRWFEDAASLVMHAVPDDGAAIFFQSDIKHEGLWVDKGALVARAGERAGMGLLFHKIVCRKPAGTVTFGRASYSHLLGWSRGSARARRSVDRRRAAGGGADARAARRWACAPAWTPAASCAIRPPTPHRGRSLLRLGHGAGGRQRARASTRSASIISARMCRRARGAGDRSRDRDGAHPRAPHRGSAVRARASVRRSRRDRRPRSDAGAAAAPSLLRALRPPAGGLRVQPRHAAADAHARGAAAAPARAARRRSAPRAWPTCRCPARPCTSASTSTATTRYRRRARGRCARLRAVPGRGRDRRRRAAARPRADIDRARRHLVAGAQAAEAEPDAGGAAARGVHAAPAQRLPHPPPAGRALRVDDRGARRDAVAARARVRALRPLARSVSRDGGAAGVVRGRGALAAPPPAGARRGARRGATSWRRAWRPTGRAVVCIQGEANAWPARTPDRPEPEIVHWVAHRPATGESYEAVIAPRRALAPSTPRHIALSAEQLRAGGSVEDWQRSWRAFVRPGDLLVQWGRYYSGLAARDGLDLGDGRRRDARPAPRGLADPQAAPRHCRDCLPALSLRPRARRARGSWRWSPGRAGRRGEGVARAAGGAVTGLSRRERAIA